MGINKVPGLDWRFFTRGDLLADAPDHRRQVSQIVRKGKEGQSSIHLVFGRHSKKIAIRSFICSFSPGCWVFWHNLMVLRWIWMLSSHLEHAFHKKWKFSCELWLWVAVLIFRAMFEDTEGHRGAYLACQVNCVAVAVTKNAHSRADEGSWVQVSPEGCIDSWPLMMFQPPIWRAFAIHIWGGCESRVYLNQDAKIVWLQLSCEKGM